MNEAQTTTTTSTDAALDAEEPGPSSESEVGEPPCSSDDDPGKPEVVVARDAAGGVSIDLAWIDAHLREALGHVGRPVARVCVRIIDDEEMVDLHRVHRGAERTTDVLTFASSAASEPVDADIAVCVDEAARRATEFGHSVERELLLYALHGVLHCAGHNDGDDRGYLAMHTEEDRILAAIGVGPVFGRDSSGHADDDGGTSRAGETET